MKITANGILKAKFALPSETVTTIGNEVELEEIGVTRGTSMSVVSSV